MLADDGACLWLIMLLHALNYLVCVLFGLNTMDRMLLYWMNSGIGWRAPRHKEGRGGIRTVGDGEDTQTYS